MNQHVPDSLSAEYEEIISRLRALRKSENLARVVQGILISTGLYLGVGMVALAAEHLFRFEVIGRTVLFWILHLSVFLVFVRYVAYPLLLLFRVLPGEKDFETARRLGYSLPGLKDHLVNGMEIVGGEHNTNLESPELTTAAFRDLRKQIDKIDFLESINYSPVKFTGRLVAFAAGFVVVVFVLFPGSFFGSLDRFWNYGQAYAATPAFRLLLEPGDKEIIKGETVEIDVMVEGKTDSPVLLLTRPEAQTEYEVVELQPGSDGAFHHGVESLTMTTRYLAASGDIRSEEYLLTVVDRPMVRMLHLTVEPPRYSGLAVQQLADNVGDVTGLQGTSVSVHVEASKELAEASLVLSDGREIPLLTDGLNADGRIHLTRDGTYHIELRDHGGLTNKDPVAYTLKVVPDLHPKVTIEVPGTNLSVVGNETLNMLFRLKDDFGFSRLRLAYRLTQSRYEEPWEEDSFIALPIPSDLGTADGRVSFEWLLAELNLVPEDVVMYHAEVFDNDNVSGPKSGRSDSFILRLPSMEEVFAGIDKKHETSLETLQEALRESEEARAEAEELQQELKKNQQEADWQEQRKAEELHERYQEIQRKIDQASQMVDELVREMDKNKVLSKETLEKYLELQRMLDQLNSPEFAEALKRLQESMMAMSPDEMAKAMEQFNLTEEQFRKSLERTMNLLKRIQIEQKVDETLRRVQEMIAQQKDIHELTREMEDSNSRNPEAARQQDELSSDSGELQKQMEQLREMMEDFASEMPLEELDQAMTQLDTSGLAEQLKQISEQMEERDFDGAMMGQQQALQEMQMLMDQLGMMRDRLQQNMQREIVNEMRKVYQDLLELSHRQERMKTETAELDRNSPLFRESAAEQMEALTALARVTERLAAVAQKTFGVTPEMGQSIGDAMNQMRSAMESMAQRSAGTAAGHQEGAMASLNEAAQHVQAGMNAMLEGDMPGMGMGGLLQRMKSLTSMQSGINQGTRHTGRMGAKQAAEMGRLAGEQGMVRKSLEQLAREATYSGDVSKLLGDLRDIAREMREVQTDLAQGSVQPQTLRKQERILSRLLDSQRSMRERDFERRRRAEAGKEYQRTRLPGNDMSERESRDQLRRDLLKAIEEGYSRDYQALIRNYFELLESEQQ